MSDSGGWDKPGPIDIRITTTPEQAIEFLELLTDDDDFRTEFGEKTLEVLARFGIEMSSEALPENIQAPPRDALSAARTELNAAQDAGAEMFSFFGWGIVCFSFLGLKSFRSFRPPPPDGE